MARLEYRQSILGILGAIARLDPMVGPTELACIWFDDLYLPGATPPEGPDSSAWIQATQEWMQCFSPEELHAMARFHATYASLVDSLPDAEPAWRDHAGWLSVADAARAALTSFDNEQA